MNSRKLGILLIGAIVLEVVTLVIHLYQGFSRADIIDHIIDFGVLLLLAVLCIRSVVKDSDSP